MKKSVFFSMVTNGSENVKIKMEGYNFQKNGSTFYITRFERPFKQWVVIDALTGLQISRKSYKTLNDLKCDIEDITRFFFKWVENNNEQYSKVIQEYLDAPIKIVNTGFHM